MGRPIPRQTYAEAPDSREAGVRDAGMSLGDALFTQTQQRVLACLFGQPARAFSVSELIVESASGSGATQRELARLAASGLVAVHADGGQRRYQANPYSPVFEELRSIVRKAIDTTPQLPLLAARRRPAPRNRA